MPDIPEGWTDDMRVALPHGRTADDVVELLVRAVQRSVHPGALRGEMMTAFDLSQEDAALALDRTFGGFVRASTKNLANCPDRTKDPIAWASYDRGARDPSLLAPIRTYMLEHE